MHDSTHLLFPLLSSILFVVAATFAKQATVRGVSPYTATALSNFLLALCWFVFGCTQGEWLPMSGWGNALWIAVAFLVGQLSTYLAFRLGDVSLATPVFGVKIIIVAFISSIVHQSGIEPRTWVAAGLATVGVIVMQLGGSSFQCPQANDAPRGLGDRLCLSGCYVAVDLRCRRADGGQKIWGHDIFDNHVQLCWFTVADIASLDRSRRYAQKESCR